MYKRGEKQNEQQYRNAFDKFSTQNMTIPSKIIEQIAFNTRPKIEGHILVATNNSTHEQHLSQPLQTRKKPFERAVTFLTGYNGIFIVTNKKVNSTSQYQLMMIISLKYSFHREHMKQRA